MQRGSSLLIAARAKRTGHAYENAKKQQPHGWINELKLKKQSGTIEEVLFRPIEDRLVWGALSESIVIKSYS